MKQKQNPEQYVKSLRAKFWIVVTSFVILFGGAVGLIGQQFIRTPPYAYLILSQSADEHHTMSTEHDELKTLLIDQDRKINALGERVDVLEQDYQEARHIPVDELMCFPHCRDLYDEKKGLGTP